MGNTVIGCWRAGAGMNKITDQQAADAEKQIKKLESMIQSMTPQVHACPISHSSSFLSSRFCIAGLSKNLANQRTLELLEHLKNLQSQTCCMPGLCNYLAGDCDRNGEVKPGVLLARARGLLERQRPTSGCVALQERENPDLLAKTPSRRRRIARGSGRTQTDVSGLLTSFTSMRSRMNQLSSMMKMQGGTQPLLCSQAESRLTSPCCLCPDTAVLHIRSGRISPDDYCEAK